MKASELSLFDCLSAEPLASLSLSQDCEAEWQIRAATWRLSIWRWLTDCGPAGWYGRTSPVCCRLLADGTLDPSSGGWQNSGMGGPTESLTLSLCEWTGWSGPFPNGGGVSSLSDILETGAHLLPYFLSAAACRGILRRAEKRGKRLPELLAAALAAGAGLRTLTA